MQYIRGGCLPGESTTDNSAGSRGSSSNGASEPRESPQLRDGDDAGDVLEPGVKPEVQIPLDDFRRFSEAFFRDIDDELARYYLEETVLDSNEKGKDALNIREKPDVCLSQISKALMKVMIFGVEDKVQVDLSSFKINDIAKSIFKRLYRIVRRKKSPVSFANLGINEMYIRQANVNNSRKRLLGTILKKRMRKYAFLRVLEALEDDLISEFQSKVKVRRVKKSRAYESQELERCIARLKEYREANKDVYDEGVDFMGYPDVFNVNDNVDSRVTRCGNCKYF